VRHFFPRLRYAQLGVAVGPEGTADQLQTGGAWVGDTPGGVIGWGWGAGHHRWRMNSVMVDCSGQILHSGQTRLLRDRNRLLDKAVSVVAQDQGSLLPPSLHDWLAAGGLARFIAVLVDEHLDLVRIRAANARDRGAPTRDPRLMVRILLYGYIIGARSSRVIERECVDDVCFRWLAAGAAPDYRAIARFRRRHLAAMGHLFVQALALCQAAGVVRLDRVALDGTRVRANVLAAEVSALLADAERIDKDEDATFGKNRRGGVVSEQPRRRETGLAEIGAACEGAGVGGEATGRSTAQRLLVGALLLALMFAGGYAVAAHKTLTLSVDGLPMTVSTMKSRVIDVVRQNGFAVGEHDSVYPGANQPVHQSDTIVLRRVGRHVPQLDLTHAPEQSRRTIEKPTKIAVATPLTAACSAAPAGWASLARGAARAAPAAQAPASAARAPVVRAIRAVKATRANPVTRRLAAKAVPAGPAVPATSRSPQARLPRRPFKGLAPSMREGASPQRQHLRDSEATAEVLWLRPSP